MSKLNLGDCALTFLGQICRTRKGYMLSGGQGDQRLHAQDAKFLIDGGIINLEDLQDLDSKPSKAGKDEGT